MIGLSVLLIAIFQWEVPWWLNYGIVWLSPLSLIVVLMEESTEMDNGITARRSIVTATRNIVIVSSEVPYLDAPHLSIDRAIDPGPNGTDVSIYSQQLLEHSAMTDGNES